MSIRELGDAYPNGWYSAGIPDNPGNHPASAFFKKFHARYGHDPDMTTLEGYQGMQFVLEAIRKAGTTDKDAVAKAMVGLTIDSPFGKVTMRTDHQADQGTWLGYTERKDGNSRFVKTGHGSHPKNSSQPTRHTTTLTLSALNTHYGQAHILRDVSLDVGKGEVVALLGRNGAGKSTTMKAVIGMVPASSGSITYENRNLRKLKNFQRGRLGIGHVPEDRRIFRHLTVIENLQTGIKPTRTAEQKAWTVDRVFGLFPKLRELQDHKGGQLSGGEQQMLTIGRTLMTNPHCLLLDEPTEGLAPIIVQQVVEAIKMLKAEGLAILLSEQNRHIAATLADKVHVIEKGRIIYGGTIAAMPPEAHHAMGW